jgi:uncharacterized protein (TIGR03492 family)
VGPVSKRSVLFLSNGYGEDSIAGKVVDRLRVVSPDLEIHGWPMVGPGDAYRERAIPVVGASNLLPSCGFATMSWSLLWTDLKAGWLSTHAGQIREARRLRGRYDLAVAVGDVVVMVAAWLARTPFLLVGCAKSSYYSRFLTGYTRLEKALLRRHCLLAFPRDRLTVRELDAAGVRNSYVGNPMMDDLEGTGEDFGLPRDRTVVGLLPGSRHEAEGNARRLLDVAAATAVAGRPRLHFLFAVHPGFDEGALLRALDTGSGWRVEPPQSADTARGLVARLRHAGGVEAWLARHRLADVLRRADLVVGLAGTANEQAVGLARPLITFPTPGVQGPEYVRMKADYFGESALAVAPEPRRVAEAIWALLDDPARRARMIAAGRERMGDPGASAAIAEIIGRTVARGAGAEAVA